MLASPSWYVRSPMAVFNNRPLSPSSPEWSASLSQQVWACSLLPWLWWWTCEGPGPTRCLRAASTKGGRGLAKAPRLRTTALFLHEPGPLACSEHWKRPKVASAIAWSIRSTETTSTLIHISKWYRFLRLACVVNVSRIGVRTCTGPTALMS